MKNTIKNNGLIMKISAFQIILNLYKYKWQLFLEVYFWLNSLFVGGNNIQANWIYSVYYHFRETRQFCSGFNYLY